MYVAEANLQEIWGCGPQLVLVCELIYTETINANAKALSKYLSKKKKKNSEKTIFKLFIK